MAPETVPAITQSTQSLCPICLRRIPARAVKKNGTNWYQQKHCPQHGDFQTLIWQGPPDPADWRRPKIPKPPPVTTSAIDQGCPFDCGLCPDHRQRSCTVIIEVTQRCNLNCPVCYADSGRRPAPDPPLETVTAWLRQARHLAGPCNLQISGGEPTCRDDLPQIVAEAGRAGFDFVQINSNGLRLAEDDDYVRALRHAGLSSVFMQCDGVSDNVHRRLRGRDLSRQKTAAIARCGRHHIGVVLVPTLVPGINTHEIGSLIQFAVDRLPTVRAVHFQPISYFGRYPGIPADDGRLTLPALMRQIETQTQKRFQGTDFSPPGCENAYCSFHARYLISPDGHIRCLTPPLDNDSCCQPIDAHQGAARAINGVARQWAAAAECCSESPPMPTVRDNDNAPMSLDAFIAQARTRTFAISAMAFQDVWNLDLNRVRDCCIHMFAPDRGLIPFCLYNLTRRDGRRLYRS